MSWREGPPGGLPEMDDTRIIRARRECPSDEYEYSYRNRNRGNAAQKIDNTSFQLSIGLCKVRYFYRHDRANVGQQYDGQMLR